MCHHLCVQINWQKNIVCCIYRHEFAVRRIKCSPHSARGLASCSYDMSLIFWDTHDENSIVAKYEHHTEFVLGCDFNLFQVFQVE
jgi:peroxin-7